MELKTKEGKYFSELGSYRQLVKIIIFIIILKIFGLWAGTIILAVILAAYYLFTDNHLGVKKIVQNIKNYCKKLFAFFLNNWFSMALVILAAFAIYWFGVRPVMIRKSCTMVEWVEAASPEIAASAGWPECQPKGNPFNTENLMRGSSLPQNCHASEPASPERKGFRKAHDDEYRSCLRENGI